MPICKSAFYITVSFDINNTFMDIWNDLNWNVIGADAMLYPIWTPNQLLLAQHL